MSLTKLSELTERQRTIYHKTFTNYSIAYKEYKVAYNRTNNSQWYKLTATQKSKLSKDLVRKLKKFERARNKYFTLCNRYGITPNNLQSYC